MHSAQKRLGSHVTACRNMTAKVSRYPRESLGGRWDPEGGKGHWKGKAFGTSGTDGPGHFPLHYLFR